MECKIKINRIKYKIGSRVILDIQNLEFSRGLYAIIGPNGAGKTTFIKSIINIISLDERSIEFCQEYSEDESAYVPATPAVDVLATVDDVIRAGLYGKSKEHLDYAYKLLDYFGLSGYRYRRFSTLSSGEQRLVCIARAFGRMPKLALLDEPLSFLDIRNQLFILYFLRKYVEEKNSIIIVTLHDINLLRFFDEIVVLSGGRIAYSGPPEDIDDKVLSEVYGVRVIKVWVEGVGYIYLPVGASGR